MFQSLKTSKLNVLQKSRADGVMSNAPYAGLVVIGAGVQMKCETLRCAQLEVLGDVDMHVEAESFVVREGGTFKGTVKTNLAEIEGTAEGELSVKERLTIHGSGKVTGDVDYGELAIEAGGKLLGNLAQKGTGNTPKKANKLSPGNLSAISARPDDKKSDKPRSKSSSSGKNGSSSEIKTWYTEDA